MILGPLIVLTVIALVYHPLMVGDYTDLATRERLQENEKRMQQEMGHLEKEFDQKSWSWGTSQSRKDLVTTDQVVDDGTWDGWHYVGLILLLLFGYSRHTMEKEPTYDSSTDSSSTSTSEDYDDTDMEANSYNTRQRMLEAFYEQHTESSDLSTMCDFVESFVNDLLEECQNVLPYQNTLPLLQNCIGVDSAFEGWYTHKKAKAFSVLLPLLPPKGHSFHLETSDSEGILNKHGHILVETECMCKRERLLGDVVCFVHHPKEAMSSDKEGAFLVHVLCTSSHLDVHKTIQWLHGLVNKAWKNISPKYNFNLTPQPSKTACRLKMAFSTGRSICIDIIPAVQQGDSLVFLATQGTEVHHLSGTVWQQSFAIQELLFFKWVNQRAPEDCCHLKCLQILIYLKESCTSDRRKQMVLTHYHYKTCLMHLLLLQPLSDWGPVAIAPRLQDILLYLHRALQDKYLPHFLIGNISLPIQIPMPKTLRSAVPPNLFKHLAQDSNLHAEAMKEFVRVVEQVRALWSACEE